MKSILRYKADRRTIAFIGIYFLIAYSGYAMYTSMKWWALIPWCILTCFFSFFCAVIVHNTIHSPMFRKKSWNKGFQYILSLAYGYSVSAFVPGHNFSHHKETQTSRDTMRTHRARFKWNLLNQLLFMFLVTGDIMKDEKRWVKKMYTEKPSWFWQWLGETIFVNGIKITLLIFNWQAALIFLFIPHLYGTWGIVGTNVWQHDGCDKDHPYNHSRSFTSPFLNYFAFNNGFHTAHHMKPGLHWSLLPEYHEKNVAPYAHPNVNRHSLFAYLWEAYIYPGKRLDYLGNPIVLPDEHGSEDWISRVNIKSKKHAEDFGAEDIEHYVEDSDLVESI